MRAWNYLFGAVGAAAGTYAALAGIAWLRYGKGRQQRGGYASSLDEFLPVREVEERHFIRVSAPADVTMKAVEEFDLEDSAVVRTLVRTRAFFMGGGGLAPDLPHGLFRKSQALGWGLLAQTPEEAVFGAVTQPWKGNVIFRPLPSGDFQQFAEPGFAKIIWNVRVRPLGDDACEVRTETRVVTTSLDARVSFRQYWSFISPGVRLIRWAVLWQLRRIAERASAQVGPQSAGALSS
jgi:hypothetical protein